MGLMDNLKGKAEELKEKAGELAGKHSEQIDHMVDRAGGAIDKATKGKYSEKIEHGASKAKGAVDDFAHKPKPGEEGAGGGPAPQA
ncbi:antitoxin [Streptomyces kaniharaensis]|uniref:Antitoxin n=1 Tax=Streptomyces kaniharaensis TaxID=212423 RepID=A0A6N7KVA6_9ACTN|nr:antitoxin [Streptomyces kaniharaensis]MQS14247.1 antitoxin [Streptomyces kaniharaensis]